MARALVPLAEGCEELEAITIIDLLRRAEIEVVSAALDDQQVKCSRGVKIVADTTLDAVIDDQFDLIVLPGGLPGADNLDNDPRISGLLKKISAAGGITAAICAAPKVLASAGLLEGKTATSYPGFIDKMNLINTRVVTDPVVIDEQLVTSRGPGTAMDFTLELIEKLCGRERRQTVENALMRP